jgi:hypothetical protein
MSQQKNQIVSYNETIRKPMIQPINNNSGVISKVVDMENYLKSSTDDQCCELKLIKQNQKKFERQMVSLLELCNKMDESVTKIKDKLSQYDIDDGDEVSHNGEVEDGLGPVEYNSDTEQQPSNYIDDSVNQVDHQNCENAIEEVVVDVVVADETSTCDENDAKEHVVDVVVADETSTCDENDAKEHVVDVDSDVKPKRKYNRRKK